MILTTIRGHFHCHLGPSLLCYLVLQNCCNIVLVGALHEPYNAPRVMNDLMVLALP